ncbi:MAG: S8 family peptidase [Candidatus Heimdallarchaeaceae archaeon]
MKKTISLIIIGLFLGVALSTLSTYAKTSDRFFYYNPGPPSWLAGDDSTTYDWQDDDPETPWGIERVYNGVYYGDQYTTSVQVAILDTGIDLDHPDLYPNIAWAVDATGGGNPNDLNGHGTHVAGTIGAIRDNSGVVGMYAYVSIYAIKVMGNGGRGSWDDLITGIYLAMQGPDGVVGTADDADVISMSLGASSDPGVDVHNAIIDAYNAGITIVASAGNDGDGDGTTDEYSYPAAYDEVIAIGATEKDDTIASFSNSGPFVEFVAPGVSIYSTYKNGGYDTLSGTSMACPHVSGLIALYLAMGGQRNPESARTWLKNNALDLGEPGWDSLYGYGLIQAP